MSYWARIYYSIAPRHLPSLQSNVSGLNQPTEAFVGGGAPDRTVNLDHGTATAALQLIVAIFVLYAPVSRLQSLYLYESLFVTKTSAARISISAFSFGFGISHPSSSNWIRGIIIWRFISAPNFY